MPPRRRRTQARRATPRRRRAATPRRAGGGYRLTSAQRRKLPPAAFMIPATRSFPVPTAAQARTAGIGEAQRLGILRNALARAAQSGRVSTSATRAKVRSRAGGKIASVRRGRA